MKNQAELANNIKLTMLSYVSSLFLILLSFFTYSQQLPECESSVPFFTLNLASSPDSIYTTPEIVRQGQCCGGGGNDNYVSFYVTLHPDVAMVEIGIEPGYADPGGSGNYNIISGGDLITPGICGPDIAGGQTACITGAGPHKITYYKPGKNKVKYYLKQIPKPLYPQNDTTRVGCSLPLNIYGLDNIAITSINSSTGNTTLGSYNSLLSCVDCQTPSFSPGLSTPAWIDYQICGTPQASACGVYQSCDTVRLYTANLLEVFVTPNPAQFCSGGNILLTASAIGGDGNYTFNWFDSGGNNISTSNLYNASMAGTYTAEVADGLVSGTCPEEYVSVPVTIGQPPVVDAGPDQTVCASSPDVFLAGSVTNATGGTWTGGLGTYTPGPNNLLLVYTPTASEISAGSVTMTLTSTGAGGGCTDGADDMTIFFSDTVFINPSYTSISCKGDITTLDANATGGTAPYLYSWSTGSSASSIGVSAGTYSVTVNDAYGCSATSSINVSEPPAIILSMSSSNTSTDIACDGTASVSISGGVGPYTVEWMDLQTTLTATGLCYGIATVTVTDALGCISVGSVVVNNQTCSAFSVSASNTDVSCYGASSAQAFSFPSGGNIPYSYSWNTSPVQTTQNATGLSAGTYTVTVTDNVGCIDLASVTVVQPTIITNVMTHTDATSIGGSEGTATANPAGGNPGYSYTWNPTAQSTQTAINLSEGVYYVNILDANLCLKTDSVQINQPPCNDFMLGVNTTNVSCYGLSNGSAYIVIAQGTPPYSISWSSGETNVTSVSGLAAGTYTVTVTDASNCTTFETFDITAPNPLSIGLVPTNISCYGLSDGTIDLTVSGGTFPYTYQWTSGTSQIGTREDLTHLKPGTYSVLVTDANGCSISGSVGVTNPNRLTASYIYSDLTCNGDDNGTINATIGGGILPYTYSWTGPGGYTNSSEDISGLEPGLYELQIVDGNGCSLTNKMQSYINEPDSVKIISYILPCPAAGSSDVVLTIDSLSGGSGEPYSISFNGGTLYGAPGVYTATLPLNASYDVLAKDSLGCVTPLVTTISIDPKVEITDVSFNPCMAVGTTNINITVTPNGGDGGAYEISTDGGSTFNTAGTYTLSLPVGSSYSIIVRDGKGCESLAWPITIPSPLDANSILSSEASCPGATDGSIDLTVIGGTTPHAISWTGPASYTSTSEDISSLSAGMYYYSITDDSSCVYNDSIEVTTIPDVTNPVITCPGDIIVNNDATLCGAVVNYTAPTASDNCSSIAPAFIPGHSLLLNQGTSYYYLSDDAYDFATSNANAINLGGHLAYFETIAESDLFIGLGPTAYYIGGIQNMSSTLYSEPDGGWEWLDGTPISYSNWAPGEPNNSPVWGGEEHMTYFSGVGKLNDYKYYNLAPYLVELSFSGSITQIAGLPSGATFPVGTTTNTFVVTDGSGNTDTCSFNITVIDNELPSISSCGATGNQNVVSDAGICTYTNSGTGWDAVATDNCSVSTVEYTLTGVTTGTGTSLDGVVFNLGTTTVVWTVTDGSGNISTCTFDVNVTDDQLPSISTCGATGTQNVIADGGVCTYTNSGTGWDAIATDNCSVSTISYTLTGVTTGTGTSLDGAVFNLGTTTVVWTVTDGAGNISTCTFDVVVAEDQLPSISSCGAVGNQNVVADFGTCTYIKVGNGWNATATDNCSVSTIIYTLTGVTTGSGTSLNGVAFNLGTTTVTWTVTDGSGNNSTCTFDVVVTDNQLPSITSCGASGNQNVVSDNGDCAFTVSGTGWDASAADNCSVSTIIYTLTGATTGTGTTLDGVSFNLGTTVVTWTVTDGSGNTSTCSFNVNVSDNQLPSIVTCGAGGNQNVLSDGGLCTYTNSGIGWDATATDNCSVSTITYVLTGATTGSGVSLDGVTFNLGTTTVTWTATDGSGNKITCSYNVVVTDNQLPAITSCGAVGTQNVVANTGVCRYTNTGSGWNATATDNCTVSSIAYTLSGATAGTGTTLNNIAFNLGTTTVTWTVTDGSGNVSTCTFDVIVTDDQLPEITSCGPIGSQTVNANLGTCTYTYSGTGWNAQATDNCTVSTLIYTLSGATTGTGTSLNGVVFNLGATNVTWTATDGSGNTSTCSFQVTVIDTQLPVILSCGATGTQNVSTNTGVCTYTVSGTGWDATASDNCGVASVIYTLTGATTGSGSSLNGVVFAKGTTTVTWLATDDSGNSVSCSFQVVVSDNETPSISGCPSNVNVNNDNGNCSAVVTWTPPTFTDNCGATMTSNYSPGATFSVGTTLVTYTVVDAAGNTSVCSFNVTVTDNELPQITCNSDVATCNPLVTYTAPSYSDNCGVASVTRTSGLPSGSVFPVGVTTINYEILDIHGNVNNCSFTVTIYPTPVLSTVSEDITCNGDGNGSIDLTVTNGTSPYIYSWSNGGSSQDLTNLVPGVYSVTVTDDNGCSSMTSDTIYEPAVLTLNKSVTQVLCYNGNNAAINIIISGGTQPYSYNWSNGATTEDITNLVAGAYSVVVTDDNGCQVNSSTTIIQPDSIHIQTVITNATCNASNGSVSVLVTGGVSPYDYSWSNGSTSLNLSNVPGGNYLLTVTDENGCVASHMDSVGTTSNLSGYIYGTDVLCNGEATGTALVVIETGNTPFTYLWSTGATTNQVGNLVAGNYSVHVEDVFGCEIDLNIEISEPDSMIVELYSPEPLDGYNISVYNGTDGLVQSTVTGGTPTYVYEWSNGATTEDIYNVSSGSYSVIVTDINGCVATAVIRLNQPQILEMPEGVSPNGDGENDFFVIHGIEAYPNNQITIYNRWGNVVYEQSGYNNDWQGYNNKGEDLPDGTYFVIFNPSKEASVEPLTGYIDLRRKR